MKFFISTQNQFYKIYFSFALFIVAMLAGVGGYMIIDDYTFLEALFMTVITVSTVGYTIPQPLSNAGQIFTIFLILTNIAIFTYFITVVSHFFLDGEFNQYYKHKRMRKAINELEGHIIICGFGRNGYEASRILDKNNIDYVVIERSFNDPDQLNYNLHYYFEADATRDEVLLEAGIKNAKALITTLPEDADNVFVVLTAHVLNPKLKIISRASHDTSVKKLKRAGADNVIMPDKIGGAQMASLILSPDVKEFMDVLGTTMSKEFQLVEIAIGKSVLLSEIDSWNKTGATILGVKAVSGEYKLNPSSNYHLKINERIIAMGSRSQLDELKVLVG